MYVKRTETSVQHKLSRSGAPHVIRGLPSQGVDPSAMHANKARPVRQGSLHDALAATLRKQHLGWLRLRVRARRHRRGWLRWYGPP